MTILVCLRQSKTSSAGLGAVCFPRMARGPARKKSESLHTGQRGKDDMASPNHDDGEMSIPAREWTTRELKRTMSWQTGQVFG
jgi:hypothetical protein